MEETDKEKKIKGKWWDISQDQEVKIVKAEYDRIRDWKMDPKGYFLIKVYPENGEVGAGFCVLPENRLIAEIRGKSALEIVNTIISKDMVSSLQHAADMGIELCKAEIAMKRGEKYVQDDPI